MWTPILILILHCFKLSNSQPSFQSCTKSTSYTNCSALSITEELLPGTVIDTFKFTDPTVNVLSFTISLKGTNILPYNYLSLNARPMEVDLVVSSRIDYEDFTQNSRSLYIVINVNGSSVAQFTFYANLVDIDDNFPAFLNMSVNCIMAELDPSQSCQNLTLVDPDLLNNIVYFQIISTTFGSTNDFLVEKIKTERVSSKLITTYALLLNTSLDYSVSKQVEIVIQAMDSANHTALNSIFINVTDVPNLPPIFLKLPYIVRMDEAFTVNTYVTTVSAIDGDRGINSPILYSFKASSFNQYFAIDPTSGIVTIQKVIIRESPDISQVYGQFNLVVIASKNEQILANNTQTTISIQINDINNSPTVFSQNTYYGSIPENSPIGTAVYVNPEIITSDNDLGANAEYSVALYQNGNVSQSFAVYPTFGGNKVILTINFIDTNNLDYEVTPFINIVIQTTQKAPVRNISMYSYANLNISLTEIDKYFPIFQNSSYYFSILENSPIFTIVGTVLATDKDFGIYGTVSYNIIDPSNKFGINSTTGLLFVNVNADNNTLLLDAETKPNYTVICQAVDGGGLMTFATINIFLIDVDDNPPVFLEKIYYSKIVENSFNFTPPLLQVKATDADSAVANTIIQYSLFNITNDSEDFLNDFSIDNTTGIITVIVPIDREELNQSNKNILYIVIKAFDPSKPNFFDFCTVYLEVQDSNDHPPILSQSMYATSIPQNISSSSMLIYINASDQDQPNTLYSLLSYKLIGNDASKFVFLPLYNGSNGGYIATDPNAALDVKIYNFTVEVDDYGTPPLSGSAQILINSTVINNHNPIFNQTVYFYSFYENITVGTIFGQIMARDSDFNANLSYSLSMYGFKAWNYSGVEVQNMYNFTTTFGINPATGQLMTMTALDSDISNKMEIQALVIDLAAQTPGQTATATITITIQDVNDNPPIFQANFFYLNILEDSTIKNNITSGATGLFTTATDKDYLAILRYNSSESSQTFVVDPLSGQIFLIKGLDREKVGFINFTVWCFDGVFITNTTVVVTVLDVNDNEPAYSGLISNFTIPQNTTIGTILAKFPATDLDIGEHAHLNYRLNGGEVANFAMSIDGNLSLANSLLGIPKAKYTILIEVFDDPNGPYHLRNDKAIDIYVTLTNNRPFFNTPSGQYSIPENSVNGFKVDVITATDLDSGENGILNYYLLPQDSNANSSPLSIFNMTVSLMRAQIFVNSSLKYKAGSYIMILRAMDNGSPRLDANYTLYINVTAINYNPPNFTNPVAPMFNQTVPSFSLMENTIGIIANITAFDPDEGVNGIVRYSLPYQNENNSNFSIDSLSGILINKVSFDREVKDLYKCRIQANDLGSPSLTTFIDINVVILDANDNPPFFPVANKSISLSINEGPQNMSLISNTSMMGFYIGTVALAIDLDLGVNAKICYFLMKNITDLYLDANTGNLYGVKFFDRETIPSYESGVKAVNIDQCNSGFLFTNTNYNVSDPSEAYMVLTVLDINDNPPFFTKSLIIDVIPRFALPGISITDFSKYSGDVDLVSQGQLRYSIQGDISISSPLSSQLQNEKITQIITLNSSSGILTIGPSVSFLNTMQGYFYMTITVNDGKFTNTTSYLTYLVSQNNRLILVASDYISNVANKTDNIASYFSQQLSAMVLVDGLELCSDTYLNPVLGCTFIYIHGFNTTTNTIINGSSLLKTFQAQASSMTDLQGKYQIYNVIPAAMNLTATPDISALQQTQTYRLIIIIICCIFFLILIIISALIIVLLANYRRQLKAYSTSSSDDKTILKSLGLPGTNLYENSRNPFSNGGIFDTGSSDDIPKKYGIHTFGDGLTLEKSMFSMKRLEDDGEVIDSTETEF